MQEVYLAHHGILGQKWGVRRYQNPDGSLTAAGRKRYAIDSDGKIRKLSSSERRAAVKMEKNRAAALEKARKARVEKAEYNKQKVEAIKSGEASKIEKYFDDLTPAEMQDAMSRINTKQNFQRMLNQEAQLVSNGKTKTDQLMDNVGKVSDYAEKGIRMYNIIAKVNNAFNSETYMPKIGDGGEWAGDRKKKLAKEAKEEADKAKEKKEKAKAEKEEKERQEWLKTASAKEILAHPEKVNMSEYETISKAFKTRDILGNYEKNQASERAKAMYGDIEENRKIGESYAKKYRDITSSMAVNQANQHENQMREIASKYGIDYDAYDPNDAKKWRK